MKPLRRSLEEVNRTLTVLADVKAERERQHQLFGDQSDKVNGVWLGILVEEVGEVAKALNEDDPVEHLREELVQVAAVATAWVEKIDRGVL